MFLHNPNDLINKQYILNLKYKTNTITNIIVFCITCSKHGTAKLTRSEFTLNDVINNNDIIYSTDQNFTNLKNITNFACYSEKVVIFVVDSINNNIK